MFLLDLLEWVFHNPGEALLRGLLLMVARNLIVLAKEEEVHWLKEKIEQMTGEKYPGHTKQLWGRAVRSSKRLRYLSQTEINRAKAPRRIKRMNTQNINWYTFIPALVAALKLIFQTLNIPFIADAQANELANGAAALLTIIGVALSHRKDGASNASATPTSIGLSK